MATRPLDAAARAALMKRWAKIPERMKAAARREIDAEAEALVDEMKRGVAVADGDLRDSIKATDESTDTWMRVRVSAGDEKTLKPVRKPEGNKARPLYNYALAVEHGTSEMDAQPFFHPTVRRRRKRFRAKLARVLRKAAQEG